MIWHLEWDMDGMGHDVFDIKLIERESSRDLPKGTYKDMLLWCSLHLIPHVNKYNESNRDDFIKIICPEDEYRLELKEALQQAKKYSPEDFF